jgi:hypothetical protein
MDDRGIQELLRAKAVLVIGQSDSIVVLRDDSGWTRDLRPDGRKIREELAQGGPAEVEAKWKGDKLMTVRRLDSGAELTERFARDKRTGDLAVEVEYKAARMPQAIKLRRIYVLADSAA